MPVKRALEQLQELWLQWLGAFYQNHPEETEKSVQELMATVELLGMRSLPDLSIGAAVRAVESAAAGDLERAAWGLDAAEVLDPDRPEVALARGAVAWRQGAYHVAIAKHLAGHARIIHSSRLRALWLGGAVVWLSVSLLTAGALFVMIQLATNGPRLYLDLERALRSPLPSLPRHVAILVILFWPLCLPLGALWVVLYWSVLLWGYGSLSERSVMAGIWILVGVFPLLSACQNDRLRLILSPPVRALDALTEGRLYGSLLTDLGALDTVLPDSPAVKHLLADFHRTLGQWELSRSLYQMVLGQEPQNASALNDLGAYHFRKGDVGSAVQYFQQATNADATSAAAFYNLSQAYSESYQFDEQRSALSQARSLDEARVGRWIQDPSPDRVVVTSGGLGRIPEIRRELAAAQRVGRGAASALATLRQLIPLVPSACLILLAATLHLARRSRGYSESRGGFGGRGVVRRLSRVLLPGVRSAEQGHGCRAFLAVWIPAALVLIPAADSVGFSLPLAFDAGSWLPAVIAGVGLALYFGARARWDLGHEG